MSFTEVDQSREMRAEIERTGYYPELTFDQAILVYVAHQMEVVTRRTEYRLRKAKEREHIVEGLCRALDMLDEVIALIRGSADVETARSGLMAKPCAFTEIQAMETVAKAYPHTHFAIVDVANADEGHLKNVEGLLFKEQEAGYLAGYAAGLAPEEIRERLADGAWDETGLRTLAALRGWRLPYHLLPTVRDQVSATVGVAA